MKKLLYILIIPLMLVGCNQNNSSSNESSSEENPILTLEKFKLLTINSINFENKNKNFKSTVKLLKSKTYVSFEDKPELKGYVEDGLFDYEFISNNGKTLESSNSYYYSLDLSDLTVYRGHSVSYLYSDIETQTIYDEVYDYFAKTEDLINYEEEVLQSDMTSLSKTHYAYKDTFSNVLYSRTYDPVYNILVNSNITEENSHFEKHNNIISFNVSYINQGEEVKYEGNINIDNYDITYVKTINFTVNTTNDCILETEYSTIHGDFEINYDTNKTYQEYENDSNF